MELFDLHCDSIVSYRELEADFLCKETQFSIRELEKFDRICQTMAIFIPDELRGDKALAYFNLHAKYLNELGKKQALLVELAQNADDILRITNEKKCALLLAVESGAALAGKLENVDYLATCGVKMMTLVWNGENEIGSGHRTSHGLTTFGRQVIRRMEEQNIIVDVSHLNDKGFDQVCEIATKPFIATHSNLRTVCGHKRNMTEPQFQEMIVRKGLVGINLHEPFLSEDGKGTLDQVYRHVYRMLELGGEDVIACGSDFDGADINGTLDSPWKFAKAAEYLLGHGISESVVHKIFFENALEFFRANVT
ncbi:dipeptidase [Lachnospiraceae bacterium LCP25S3_G4]